MKSIYWTVNAFFYMVEMTIDEFIEKSLQEDIGPGDVTTSSLENYNNTITAFLLAREKGILAGLDIALRVFLKIDTGLKFESLKKDGDILEKGDKIALISGNGISILKAERVALNVLQRLCGVASLTRQYVRKIEKYPVKLLDTRKTTPLFRSLEKYAVRIGGGYNHRFGLYDMIMLKENHIRLVGSITKSVQLIKDRNSTHKIEVEVTNLEELEEAVLSGADRVMLDNMTIEKMKEAVDRFGKDVELEASGNINLDTIESVARTGVHYISCGALTHSYKAFDISLLFNAVGGINDRRIKDSDRDAETR